jgi:hypothetical protein
MTDMKVERANFTGVVAHLLFRVCCSKIVVQPFVWVVLPKT